MALELWSSSTSNNLNHPKATTEMGDKKPPEFVIDSQSPYYLPLLDAPSAIITAIKFDEKNYELWEKVVTTTLTTKSKIAFIDGRITKLEIKKWQ